MQKRLVLVVSFGLMACQPTTPLVDQSGVLVVAPDQVFGCTPLSVFTTTTGVTGGAIRERSLEIARNTTLQNVRDAGGDTAVFESGGPGSNDLFVRARGYRCQS
ncbi:MAG: hypothetical protein AAGA87_12660 [Pseudomonadota bacterium]